MPSKITNKYILLDRDGVIIEDRGYVHKTKDLKFLPGAITGLRKFQSVGYKFIIITNQAGIARCLYTLKDAEQFNKMLLLRLAAKGIKIEKTYYCPHHPKFTGDCECRKPKVGMIRLAEKEFDFDASNAIFIGDKDSDTELGKNCGGLTVLIENNQYQSTVKPDFKAKDLNQAFNLLKAAHII